MLYNSINYFKKTSMFPDITSPVFLHYFALNSLLAGFIIYLFSYRLFKFNFFINILLASIASGIIGLAISFLVL